MASKSDLTKLKNKTGVCKRLHKDLIVYEKESKQQQEKINTMKANQEDPYVIKKQEEVLSETFAMIPDTKNRLETALSELTSIIESLENTVDHESKEWKEALQIKSDVEKVFETPM